MATPMTGESVAIGIDLNFKLKGWEMGIDYLDWIFRTAPYESVTVCDNIGVGWRKWSLKI